MAVSREHKTTIGVSESRKRLALLWFSSSGFLVLLLLLQTAMGHYGAHWQDAWSWFMPTSIPSLSLIASVFALDIQGKTDSNSQVDRFGFRLCFCTSVFYLGIVALTIFLGPIAESYGGVSSLELMNESHFWLAPLQGIVSATLGWFFVKKETAKDEAAATLP